MYNKYYCICYAKVGIKFGITKLNKKIFTIPIFSQRICKDFLTYGSGFLQNYCVSCYLYDSSII